MEYRYTAVVLKKSEVGETDRLYTLYTREAGKMTVVAKGVRKPKAKLAAQLENGSLVSVTVVRTTGAGRLAGALAEETWPYSRQHLTAYQKVLWVLARVGRITEPGVADERVFDLLLSFVTTMNDLAKKEELEKSAFVAECFLLKLYAALGYTLQLTSCLSTGEKLAPSTRYWFCPSDGGIATGAMAVRYPGAFAVSQETIVLLRLILTNSLRGLLKVQITANEARNIQLIGERFYQATIEH